MKEGAAQLPLVSVVVITYNQERFIADCLDSILAQDYTALEIIVADDCSTDGTTAIVREYAARYPGKLIPAIAEKNGGITQNCNNGLALCRGKYFCLTGGDDLFLPGKIQAQVNWFAQNPDGAICTTAIDVFDSDTDKTILIYRSKEFIKGGPARRIITQKNQPPSSNFMIDREKCADLVFDKRTPVVSDWLFYTEAAMRGKIGYIDGIYLRYRRHVNNTTAPGAGKSYLDDRLVYTDLLVAKYPHYYGAAKIQRANIFFEAAKREFFIRNFGMARHWAQAGIREYFFDFRNWALFFATFAGNTTHRISGWYKKRKLSQQ
jgi:glycosyltransferase involved in cell wall biosynthesis